MNDIYSQNSMGYFYATGLVGVSENLDSAKYWYQLAVDNNQPQKLSLQQVEEIKKNSKDNLDFIKNQEIEEQLRRAEISTRSNSPTFKHQCNWCGKGYNGYGWDTNVMNDRWVVQQSAEKTGIVGSTIFELDYIWARNVYCTRKCATESIRGGY